MIFDTNIRLPNYESYEYDSMLIGNFQPNILHQPKINNIKSNAHYMFYLVPNPNSNSSNNESGYILLVIQLAVVEKVALKINCLHDILNAFDVTLRNRIMRYEW